MEDVFEALVGVLVEELKRRDPEQDWDRALNDIIFAAHIGCLSAKDTNSCENLEQVHRLAYERAVGTEIAARRME